MITKSEVLLLTVVTLDVHVVLVLILKFCHLSSNITSVEGLNNSCTTSLYFDKSHA